MKDRNEQRTLLAIGLSMAVFWIWSIFFAPPPPEAAERADGVAAEVAGIGEDAAGAGASSSGGAVATAGAASSSAAASSVPACTGAATELSNGSVTLRATDCGGLTGIGFPGVEGARLVTPWWSWAFDRVAGRTAAGWSPYTASPGDEQLLTGQAGFLVVGRGDRVVPEAGPVWATLSTSPLVQQVATADGLTVTRTLTPVNDTTWNVEVRFSSDRPLNGPFWVGAVDRFHAQTGRGHSVPQLLAFVDGDLESVADAVDVTETTPMEGPTSWFGIGDKYFLAALAPSDPAAGALEWGPAGDGRVGAFFVVPVESLAANTAINQSFLLYTGARELGALDAAGHDLSEAGSLGIFGFFAKILLFTLHLFQSVLVNWGSSILALTFLVRLSVYPLTRTAVQSGRRMQALQPELKKLQEECGDDKERFSREMWALYSKNGVNPMGGCFPMLVQMPVFFALYAALSYEPGLFGAGWLYLHDLSAPDPYGLLGILIVAGMYVQQAITPMTGMDPTQQSMMKLMPLIFGFTMFGMPSGLALYYVLNTVLAIAQQWYNTRSIPVISPGGLNVAT